MRVRHVVLAAGLMLAAASTAILAKDPSWVLRAHGAFMESSANNHAEAGSGVESSIDIGGGFGVGAEYRFSGRLGLEFSALFAGLEIRSSLSAGSGVEQRLDLTMMPLTLAVPFHFDTGGRADLFVAPTLSVVRYLDVQTAAGATGGVSSRVGVDSDTALGAALGVELPFGNGHWALSAGLRYLKTGIEDTDLDPVIATLGFAYRF